MKRLSLLLLTLLCASNLSAQEQVVKKIHAHMTILDDCSACEEAREGLKRYPQSKTIREAYIKALAKSGHEKEMMEAWHEYVRLFPEDQYNRDLLEHMAWGVIRKGSTNQSPIIRVLSLLASFFAQDAKGVDILHRTLSDTNSLLRGAAVQLSANMRDQKLRDEMKRLLKEEKVWAVRVEVIKALGMMKVRESKEALVAIVAADNTTAEEKAAAIQSLVALFDTADRKELQTLAKSPRAGLRQLACEIISFLDLYQELDLVIPLLKDNRADVRAAAIETLGVLRVKEIGGKPIMDYITPKLDDLDPTVAITAAWVLTLNQPELGQKAFQKWLKSETRDVRLLAAAALARSGSYGMPLMKTAFRQARDPYVRMNLAIGLMGQRVCEDEACEALYRGLNEQKERLMWKELGVFQYLAPSDLKQNDLIPNYPEANNQLVRLEILNRLAILKYPQAQEGVKRFLMERTWGVTGLASALLLSEGDDSAIDLIRNLLTDSNTKVRIQAAMILALWDSGEEAVEILQQSYATAEREVKERILEAVGHIGLQSSIPFLVKGMEEPFQTLRIIAASSLLQCLYH